MMFLDSAAVVVAYLIGSIPTGFLVARLCGVADIRGHGSGTIGATNVARVLGKKYFILVFMLDACKAFAWLWFLQAMQIDHTTVYLAGMALIMGNVYSLFLLFTGGKGVATSVGVFLALQPIIIGVVLLPFFVVLALSKRVGFASIAGLIMLPIAAWGMANTRVALLALCASVLCLYAHRGHISKLFS